MATYRMTLPDFLEMDDVGFINLTGHRIGLHDCPTVEIALESPLGRQNPILYNSNRP